MNRPVLVIMAAGLGSRYGGLKQLDPVGPEGQAILEYSVYDAKRAGFEKAVFIIRPELEGPFEEALGSRVRKYVSVEYAYQTTDNLPEGLKAPEERTKPLGTAHAVWCAKKHTGGCPIAVINADDFYGADAFQKIYDYLSNVKDGEKYEYCMVGYKVENTLTDNGTVARGECSTDEGGFLTGIIERTSMSRRPDGRIMYEGEGEIKEGSLVSMNLWGFTPSFLPLLDDGLKGFFGGKLKTDPMKAEYYLPAAVDKLIKAGRANVKVLSTDARWFGVTYKEDKPVVKDAILKLTEKGIYPREL